jgi:hypothetical protein
MQNFLTIYRRELNERKNLYQMSTDVNRKRRRSSYDGEDFETSARR